jgi:hypothetical protein
MPTVSRRDDGVTIQSTIAAPTRTPPAMRVTVEMSAAERASSWRARPSSSHGAGSGQ